MSTERPSMKVGIKGPTETTFRFDAMTFQDIVVGKAGVNDYYLDIKTSDDPDEREELLAGIDVLLERDRARVVLLENGDFLITTEITNNPNIESGYYIFDGPIP